MVGSNVGIGLSFLAGLASFLSPCVFSLVPAYIGYLGGRSAASSQSVEKNRWFTFSHGLAFVFGFSVVFILLGIAASALGGLLYDVRTWLAKIGGIVVIFFGLHMIHLLRIPFLEYDLRHQTTPNRKGGYVSSVLGAILTLSLSGGSITQGAGLLTAYSVGLAIPFLVAALGVGWVTTILRRFGRVMHYTEIAMGIILIIVGVMLFLGTFENLARFGVFVDFGL